MSDPLRQDYAMASAIAPSTPPRPNRRERRAIWAGVPRAVKQQARAIKGTVGWLPARTRLLLSRDITRRNDLDRSLAVGRGMAPDDARCARFRPELRDALDRVARKRHGVGLGAPSPAMAAGIWAGLEGS